MSVETIARRYATALADVVVNSGQTDAVRTELKEWEILLSANSDLQSTFNNPTINHDAKTKVLEELLARARPSKTTANFLRVLLRNGRLSDLAEINEKLAAIIEERSGIVSASITSARDLPGDERSELKQNLERLTGKQVNIEFNIDQEIIGCVVTRIGSTVYDGSVRTQLDNLKEQLVNG
jgi:F-type H+-transporting ATPase subunit delta